jgi:hypothetical protein
MFLIQGRMPEVARGQNSYMEISDKSTNICLHKYAIVLYLIAPTTHTI